MSSLHYAVRILLATILIAAPVAAADFASSFRQAKEISRNHIYMDRNQGAGGTVYCGCDWRWVGESGGRVDWASCGYQVRAQENRALRTEWEHIVPAHSLGHQRQCWQNGGRRNCTDNDPVFRQMYVDLHNLTVSVGEINADRSNFRFSPLPNEPARHGACPSRVSFQDRQFEPRDEAKGFVARVYFYMHNRYGLPMSRQQERILIAWDRQFPVTAWELERAQRIERIQGTRNPFVQDGERWTEGRKVQAMAYPAPTPAAASGSDAGGEIIGNTNSKVYHLPEGCPSYSRVAPHNRRHFNTEAEATAAGYRKAGNCR